MVMIISDQGYPKDDEVLTKVDYYIIASPCEGGILIVGKDSQGREYKPKNEPAVRSSYVLPSGTQYRVPVGSEPEKNHPAIYFPFQLNRKVSSREILEANESGNVENLLNIFDLTLMDESMQKISLDVEIERWFKYVAAWGAFELAEDARIGNVSAHFWGEMYRERTPALEKFLEAYRG